MGKKRKHKKKQKLEIIAYIVTIVSGITTMIMAILDHFK